jgi:hypothetical protein
MTAPRIVLTVFAFITGYLTSTFVIMSTLPVPKLFIHHSNLVSALLAVALCLIILKSTANIKEQLLNSILIGGVVGGGVVFLLTFFGALVLYPECNVCPVMSMFFAPIGFFLGLFGGWLVWKMKAGRTAK